MKIQGSFHNSFRLNGPFSIPNTIKNSLFPVRQALKRAEPEILLVGGEPLKEDLWGFDGYWWEIRRKYKTVEALYAAIGARHEEIRRGIESFRPRIEWAKKFDPIYAQIEALALAVGERGDYWIDPSRLVKISDGVSGSYFLVDEKGEKKFVVKPIDEDCGCINNTKGFATPFDMSPIREDMPLYLSSLKEAMVSEIANLIGIGQVAPKTVLAILESSTFTYLIDHVNPQEMNRYLETLGEDLREKLCSVQEYIANSKTLFEAQHELQWAGLSDEEIANRFDQRDVEDANILIWTTYDTDAHGGNILVYAKGTDAIGNEILGIKKIDNGLAFPDKNTQLRNALNYLPNAKRSLSEEGRRKIEAIDVESLASQLEASGLGSAVPALRARMSRLKELARQPDITLYQINKEMSRIG